MERVFVVGVGMTKFHKPGTFDGAYYDLAKEAGTNALKDAGVDYEAIEQVAVGYVYGDSTCGNRAAYEIGLTGIPIYNVNNNCATGSTADPRRPMVRGPPDSLGETLVRLEGGPLDPAFGEASVAHMPNCDARERHRPAVGGKAEYPVVDAGIEPS